MGQSPIPCKCGLVTGLQQDESCWFVVALPLGRDETGPEGEGLEPFRGRVCSRVGAGAHRGGAGGSWWGVA